MKTLLASLLLTALLISPAHAADKKPAAAKEQGPTIDLNKDGKISLSEAQALAGKQFGLYDTDKNGSMSLEEYRKPLDEIAKMRKLDAAKKAGEEKIVQASFVRMDNDGDKQVSKNEFQSDAQLRHATMDINKDGFVTPEEVDELQKKIIAAHKKAGGTTTKK